MKWEEDHEFSVPNNRRVCVSLTRTHRRSRAIGKRGEKCLRQREEERRSTVVVDVDLHRLSPALLRGGTRDTKTTTTSSRNDKLLLLLVQ